MTEALDPEIAALIQRLEAIDDPGERDQVTRDLPDRLDKELRGVRQRTALGLKDQGMKYREIGAVMGGVTAQRIEQIIRGV